MALLRMQADMQCKSYFAGHYSSVDLNLDASGSIWPYNNADTIMRSEQYCNGTLSLSSPNDHWAYNKEEMKQTMLKQQTIFRDQVHELHRLYWRQKELMDEMKRNKLQNHHLNLEYLQSNPHWSQKSCDFPQKECHVLSLPHVNPACNQLFVSTAGNSQLLSNFNEGKSTHAGLDLAETKFSLEGCHLESKCKKFGKKILDLERPAYEYIDIEEEESTDKVHEVSGSPQEGISEVVQTSNHRPYRENASLNSILQKDYSNADTIASKKNCLADLNEPLELEKVAEPTSTYLADLNEPIKLEEEATPMSKFVADLNEPFELQEEIASSSRDFPSLSTDRKLPYQDSSQKSSSGLQVLPTDELKNTELRSKLEISSSGLQLEKNKIQEWPCPSDEAGQSGSKAASLLSGFSEEEVSKSLEDVELKQAQELPSSFVMDQSKEKSDSESLQSLEKALSPNSNSDPEWASCQLISLTDVGNAEASLVSNGKKHLHDFVRTPIAVQALPCFNSAVPLSKSSRSPFTSTVLTGKKSHHSKNLKSCPKFDSARFHKHSCGSNSESKTLESSPPSIDCNGMVCSNNDDLTSEQQGPVKIIKLSMDAKPAKEMNSNFMLHSSDGEKRIEDSTEGLLSLKTNLVFKGKGGKTSDCSNQMESVLLQANSACTLEVEMKKVGASNNSSSKKLVGGEELTTNELVVANGLTNNISGFGSGIDLNSCVDEHESSPAFSVSTKPDLEAPVSPETKESSRPRGESEENQVDTPCQMSEHEDGDVREEFGGTAVEAVVLGHEGRDAQEDILGNLVEALVSGQERGNVQDDIVKNAAAALFSISSSKVQTFPEMTTCGPPEPCWSEDLNWFARVASQVEDDPSSEFGIVRISKENNDVDQDCLSNGLDYFEAMTLELAETKLEDLRCVSNEQKDQNVEAIEATSMPRRGRMRRAARQQRKDFQTEILPSLVSLSRSEITADLLTIEGLIEAANNSLKIDSSRTTGRNARAKGGRRSSISLAKATEAKICSHLKLQASNKEKGNVERKLIGWGNITRRRTPRFPASSTPRVN